MMKRSLVVAAAATRRGAVLTVLAALLLMESTASHAQAPSVGQSFKDCPQCPEMVVIPAGKFRMGAPASEPGTPLSGTEQPQIDVKIEKNFAIGKYEVTFAEWDACVGAGGCGGFSAPSLAWGRGLQPAINLSWNDAKSYVTWLSQKTGVAYRLPSEAEWEYAARGGTTTAYWTGSSITTSQVNYNALQPYRPRPVGSFPANPFGLHEVHGNVWEYVEDCYHPSHSGASAIGLPYLVANCPYRVSKGGSWNLGATLARAAVRSGSNSPADRRSNHGFRVARGI